MHKPVPGLYDRLITEALDKLLEKEPTHRVDRHLLKEEAYLHLANHIRSQVQGALQSLSNKPDQQAALINQLLSTLVEAIPGAPDDPILSPPEALRAIGEPHPVLDDSSVIPEQPLIPLSASDLLVNARDEPRVGTALKKEIPSADRIDLLCAFIRWHGFRILRDALQSHVQRGKRLRVLTTTYMGATQRRALDAICALHPDLVEVRLCYEVQTTRLHAKAWLLHRESGFSTAFVGSSNLSHSALMDGMEWNVRLSHTETPGILEKFRATFEDYWRGAARQASRRMRKESVGSTPPVPEPKRGMARLSSSWSAAWRKMAAAESSMARAEERQVAWRAATWRMQPTSARRPGPVLTRPPKGRRPARRTSRKGALPARRRRAPAPP